MTMANGNGDAQRLEKLEVAIRGTEAAMMPAPDTAAADDVVARVEAAAELCRSVGKYASDHGQYLDQISTAFAERLQEMVKDYATNVMAAERRKMSELEKIMGKIAGK
jgi:hypothetical protein